MISRLFDIEFDHPPKSELRFDQGLRHEHGSVDVFTTVDGVELVISVVWRPQADLTDRRNRTTVGTEDDDALARYNDVVVARMRKQLRGLRTVDTYNLDINGHRGIVSELKFTSGRLRPGKTICRRQALWHCTDTSRVLALQVSAYHGHQAVALDHLNRILASLGCHVAVLAVPNAVVTAQR